MKRFDRKFGVDFISGLPQTPAVYLFSDETGEVLYVGKAKNIRRRLSNYRNAGRRKVHRKLRTIVREAHTVEIRLQASEQEALLVENQLIRELRPRYNVDGAFDFLYPGIAVGFHDRRLLLCLASDPEPFRSLNLSWHGTFRPRSRARKAFESLVNLLGRIGHVEPRSRLPKTLSPRGSHLVAIRRVPEEWLVLIRDFLDGENATLLGVLSTALLESQEARRMATLVEEELRDLAEFYGEDIARLREARIATGHSGTFVPNSKRDSLFIRTRFEPTQPVP